MLCFESHWAASTRSPSCWTDASARADCNLDSVQQRAHRDPTLRTRSVRAIVETQPSRPRYECSLASPTKTGFALAWTARCTKCSIQRIVSIEDNVDARYRDRCEVYLERCCLQYIRGVVSCYSRVAFLYTLRSKNVQIFTVISSLTVTCS